MRNKTKTNIEPPQSMGSTPKQHINNRTTALERQQSKPPGDLNALYWYQIFALDSVVVAINKII